MDDPRGTHFRIVIESELDTMTSKTTLSALLTATMMGRKDLVLAAIHQGADLDHRDPDGRTSLFQAVIQGDDEIVGLLINKGADVKARDNTGETPLHFAAREYRLHAAKLLIEAECDVDPQEEHGNTPLSRAVFGSRGRGEMIHLLLAFGADRNRKNNYGVSPLTLAESIGNYNIVQFFR